MRRILGFLTKPRGRKSWSIFLWSTAGAALLGIPIVIVFPKSVPLVWLAIIGIPANSPLGPVMPTLFEPFVMEVAKYNAPLLVTTVATGVYVYMEFVNWYVYGWILNWDRFNALPEKRWIKWGVSKFARFPFMTILFFAATPVPFWVVRCLAILKKYPLGIFLVATAIGRFPRFYMYAWLGDKLLVPTPILLAVAFGTAIILVTWKLLHGRRMLEDTILDK